MELTRDEMLTMHVVLYTLINEVPYKEVNKYLGDITIDRAYELFERMTKELQG